MQTNHFISYPTIMGTLIKHDYKFVLVFSEIGHFKNVHF